MAGIAKVELREYERAASTADLTIIFIPVMHGDVSEIIGYRIGQFAYLTDFSEDTGENRLRCCAESSWFFCK